MLEDVRKLEEPSRISAAAANDYPGVMNLTVSESELGGSKVKIWQAKSFGRGIRRYAL